MLAGGRAFGCIDRRGIAGGVILGGEFVGLVGIAYILLFYVVSVNILGLFFLTPAAHKEILGLGGTTMPEAYHHKGLRTELLRLGLEALEVEGVQELSLRSIAARAGVSKTAPYRHFADKDGFLGALADEGFRILCSALEEALVAPTAALAEMGRAYMAFAARRPALYRLMNSPIVCRMPEGQMPWARRSLKLLATVVAASNEGSLDGGVIDVNAAAAAWAYIHGLVLIRIDGLFPGDLDEPDWDLLASNPPRFLVPIEAHKPRSP